MPSGIHIIYPSNILYENSKEYDEYVESYSISGNGNENENSKEYDNTLLEGSVQTYFEMIDLLKQKNERNSGFRKHKNLIEINHFILKNFYQT